VQTDDSQADPCQILVNGKSTCISKGSTVDDLLQQLKVGPAVAVEVDGELVTRERHLSFKLQEGARLEIVTLAGGG